MAKKEEMIKEEAIEVVESKGGLAVGDNVKLLRMFDAAGRPIHPKFKNYSVMAIDGHIVTIGKNDEIFAVMRMEDLKK